MPRGPAWPGSDGRIIGRSEPFAKVLQSSRLVKQAVGLTAWGILEDIALDATLDAVGRLVAETSARRIAANLGINKATVTRHLARLRDYGFLLHEEVRHQGSGRYETARYILDPSACLERFTAAPSRRRQPRPDNPSCEQDTSDRQQRGTTPPPLLPEPPPPAHAETLQQLGIRADLASTLARRYSRARITEVVDAATRQASRNPAGWAIRALEGGWEVSRRHEKNPATVRRADTTPRSTGGTEIGREQRWQDWDRAVSASLDDEQLVRAVEMACSSMPPMGRVGPAVRAQLIHWAVHTFRQADGQDFGKALHAALALDVPDSVPAETAECDLPLPPPAPGSAQPLRIRLTATLSENR
jgi:hypothetical protein